MWNWHSHLFLTDARANLTRDLEAGVAAGTPVPLRYTVEELDEFERALREGRHRREEDFGNVVLLVCALGSRWCTDRTVLLGVGDDTGRLTPQERSARAPAAGPLASFTPCPATPASAPPA